MICEVSPVLALLCDYSVINIMPADL